MVLGALARHCPASATVLDRVYSAEVAGSPFGSRSKFGSSNGVIDAAKADRKPKPIILVP